MRAVGGYLELELANLGNVYHKEAIRLNTGRNAFEHILIANKYEKVYLPYYTCDALIEPLKRLGIKYSFYHINSDLYPELDFVEERSALLYTNYYGLMVNNVKRLNNEFSNLIVDNAQAFYDKPVERTPTFYSPRKFFGLPDGGLVCNSNELDLQSYPEDISGDRISHLITRIEIGAEKGFLQYKRNESLLANQPIKRMSKFTQLLMQSIDYERIKTIRNGNFNYLHESLKTFNKLTTLIEKSEFICPLVYPFLADGNLIRRNELLCNRLFTPKYWPNVLEWCKEDDIETDLTENLIPIPIDQRYGKVELSWFVKILKK